MTPAEFEIENAPARIPLERSLIDRRVVLLCAWSVLLALTTGFIAQGLVRVIGLVTNLAFYGRWSFDFVSPAAHRLGAFVIVVPVIGGVIVGIMARY